MAWVAVLLAGLLLAWTPGTAMQGSNTLRALVVPPLPDPTVRAVARARVPVEAARASASAATQRTRKSTNAPWAPLPVAERAALREIATRRDRGDCRADDLRWLEAVEIEPGAGRVRDAVTFLHAEVARCLGRRGEAARSWQRIADGSGRLRRLAATRIGDLAPGELASADGDESHREEPDVGASSEEGAWAPGAADALDAHDPLLDALTVARRLDRDGEAFELALAILAARGPLPPLDALDACAILGGRQRALAEQGACVRALLARPDAGAAQRLDAVVRHLVDVIIEGGDQAPARALLETREVRAAAREIGAHAEARRLYWGARADAALGSVTNARWEAVWEAAPVSIWGLFADERLAERGRSRRTPSLLARALHRPLQHLPGAPGEGAWELLSMGLTQAATREARRSVRRGTSPHDREVDLALALLASSGAYQDALWLGSGRYPPHRRTRASWESTPAAAVRAAWPVPFAHAFGAASRATGIEASWLVSIARRESHFRPDVRSRVGARGLMQVRPSTAREVIPGIPTLAASRWSLYDPETSTRVAAELFRALDARFAGCRAAMAAAYATGPNRVGRWIDARPDLPTDLWLESVPYPVIRNYTAEALISSVVYAVVLGEEVPRHGVCRVRHVGRHRGAPAPLASPSSVRLGPVAEARW